MTYVAWDIETCPTPIDEMSEQQLTRYEKELARELDKNPELSEEEASQKVRALSPMLGWICCISLVSYRPQADEMGAGTSYARDRRREEPELLEAFWKTIRKVPRTATFVTFNGKRFDAPFLRTRSIACEVDATRSDILDTHRYRHDRHADLMHLFPYVGLADVCDLLGVRSPKADMDGSGVATAVEAGRLADVVKYCERDARATMECFLACKHYF